MNYVLISVFLFIVAIAITNASKKDFEIKMNKLVDSLGGFHNITNYELDESRFIVTLKDTSLVNKGVIQKMGAKGIVEMDNQVKIILSDDAAQLKKCIKELK